MLRVLFIVFMGIKFSPGCACCGVECVAYIKLLSGSGPFASLLGPSITINGLGHLGPAFSSVPVGYTDIVVSNHDLVSDIFLNVFNPGNVGLPLNNFQTLVGDWSNTLAGQIPLPEIFVLAGAIPILTSATMEFGLFILEGSKGSWDILGHSIKTASGSSPAVSVTFNIDTSGNIT